MNTITKTASFVQEQKFSTKSERFQHVKPEYVEQVLNGHGFNLISLRTGIAKNPERAGHQTTIARYRSQADFKINGLSLDIVAKIPHLYGAIELFLGTYRQVCSNGLVVGEKFESVRIKHLGNPLHEIDNSLTRLVAQESTLVETIKAMQGKQLSFNEIMAFAKAVAIERIGTDAGIVNFKPESLLVPHRPEDTGTDLFTVLNVIQENSLRSAMPYTRIARRADGVLQARHLNTRRVNEQSAKALEINRTIWNVATEILQAA